VVRRRAHRQGRARGGAAPPCCGETEGRDGEGRRGSGAAARTDDGDLARRCGGMWLAGMQVAASACSAGLSSGQLRRAAAVDLVPADLLATGRKERRSCVTSRRPTTVQRGGSRACATARAPGLPAPRCTASVRRPPPSRGRRGTWGEEAIRFRGGWCWAVGDKAW
jgi:hypothetical protein